MRSQPKNIGNLGGVGSSATMSATASDPSPQKAILIKLIALIHSYQQTGQKSYFKSAQDLVDATIESKSELVKFLRATSGPPTEEMAENAFKNLQSMWPQVAEELTTTILIQIHQCVRASGITVRIHYLRMFLVNCSRSVKQTQQPMTDFDAAQIALSIKERISMMTDDDGFPNQKPKTQLPTFADFMNAEADKLKLVLNQLELKMNRSDFSATAAHMVNLIGRLRQMTAESRKDVKEIIKSDSE